MLSCLLCVLCYLSLYVFFFKQKTAYEMRISDWSSDVCSSDLHGQIPAQRIRPCISLALQGRAAGRGMAGQPLICRGEARVDARERAAVGLIQPGGRGVAARFGQCEQVLVHRPKPDGERKSTRLNSSH